MLTAHPVIARWALRFVGGQERTRGDRNGLQGGYQLASKQGVEIAAGAEPRLGLERYFNSTTRTVAEAFPAASLARAK